MTAFCERLSPDIYIETAEKIYRNDIFKEYGIMGSKWKTKSIVRFEQGKCGVYCAWDLRTRNHAQVCRSQRHAASVLANKRGVKIEHVNSVNDYVDHGNLIVLQGSNERYKQLGVERLDLKGDVVVKLLKKLDEKEINQRGNVQIGGGFAAENHKLVGDITVPQPTKSIDSWLVKKMVLMTGIIQNMAKEFVDQNWCPYGDEDRVERFANTLPKKYDVEGRNVVEHLTFALTTIGEKEEECILFVNHVDVLNCPEWSETFSYWEHFFDPVREKWFRVVAIAYGRACVLHSMNRQYSRNVLFSTIVKYVKNSTDDRKRLMGARELVEDQVELVLPKFPKGSFYGCFVTSIRAIGSKHGLCLSRFAELLLVCGWVTTGMNICSLYNSWQGNLPKNNLAVAALDQMLQLYGGLLRGKGQRYQPFFNFSVSEKDVIGASQKLTFILRRIKSEKLPYMVAWRMVGETIIGYGGLSAQHVLAIAALCGVIDGSFATTSVICLGTNTYEKIKERYNLRDAVLKQLVKDLAIELQETEATIENIFCECMREISSNVYNIDEHQNGLKRRKLMKERGYNHPDVVFKDQSFFEVISNKIIEILPDGTRQEASQLSIIDNLEYDGRQGSNPNRMLKITSTSRARKITSIALIDDIKNGKKKSTGSVRKHSGIGKPMQCTKEKKEFNSEDRADLDITFKRYFNEIEKQGIAWRRVRTRSGNSFSQQPLSMGEIVSATKENGTYSIFDVMGEVRTVLDGKPIQNSQYPRKKRRRKQKFQPQLTKKIVIEDGFEQQLYTCRINGNRDCSFLTDSKHCHLGCGLVIQDGFHGYSDDGFAYYYSCKQAIRACCINALVYLASKQRQNSVEETWYERKLPKMDKQIRGTNSGILRDYVVLMEKIDHRVNNHRLFGALFFCQEQRILAVPIDPDNFDTCQWYSYRIPTNS
jgi:hypothetical protein